ncbi:MAG TPA: glycoside hydrolase family 13 protein [Candidatus Binatia bacterium]|nr:glycoside hydrolase family 13 protein [Candidatus Binatia bacterium]
MDTPDWVRDAVFYQIFPDRFARSLRLPKPDYLEDWDAPPTLRGYKGGDLYGIVEHLDHIQSLGANALYLTPIFQAASNHRYNTHDYYQVDPLLGGTPALRELLDTCHARGMKVMLDGVFNHAGRGFFPFHDLLENGMYGPYRDWFHIHSFPLNAYQPQQGLGYSAWWGLPSLPKFNITTPAVREFLWGVATHWLEFGIDGWRLDTPNEINDDSFWQEFRHRCRAINPEAYLVGEIWGDASRWLQGDQFDAVMHYELTRTIFGFVAADSLNQEEIRKGAYKQITPLSTEEFAQALKRQQSKYRPEVTAVQFTLLGSHDPARALTIVGEDESALRLALLFQMTYPGAPCVYYGDEIGLKGRHDPLNRQGMPWHQPENWNRALFEYTQYLIRLRHEHAALRRGKYRELYARDGVYAFARELPGESFLMVVLNVNRRSAQFEISTAVLPELRGEFHDLLGQPSVRVDHKRLIRLSLPARSGSVFRQL